MNLYYLFDALFFGFAAYSSLFLIIKWFAFYKKRDVFKKIEAAAITIVCLAAVVNCLFLLVHWASIFWGNDTEQQMYLQSRFLGPYSFGLWLQPLTYLIFTQLLRIGRIAQNAASRFFIAFLLFFDFEKYVIIITSFHRDYLPSSWTMYGGYSFFGWIITEWILKIIIFSSFVTVAYYVKNRKTF